MGAHGIRGLCRAILIPSCRNYYKEVVFIMNNETLEFIQEQLEYEFDEPKLQRQAFTRKSYSEEHNGAYNNEVLEFYGDKALEFIVMKKLSEYFGETTQNGKYASQKTEGQLTEIKKKLVCKKMLAHRIDIFGFKEFLFMGKGDIQQHKEDEPSVKEDLFEAILGAVAIDCNWNMQILQSVTEIMLDPDSILRDDSDNYVPLIHDWFLKEYKGSPEFKYDNSAYYDETSLLRTANEIRSNIKRDNTSHVINVQEYYQTHFKCWLDLYNKRFVAWQIWIRWCYLYRLASSRGVC